MTRARKCRRNVGQGVPPGLNSLNTVTEEREETRLTSAAKVTRKTKKSTAVNKETEAVTNDTRVHSSHSEEQLENVGENQNDGPIEFRFACRPCGRL